MAFATPADLQQFLGRTDCTDAEELQAELILDLVSDEIRAISGQVIDETTATHKLAGTWARDLHLPQHPITAVSAVSVNDTTLAAGAFSWNERALIRRYGTFVNGFDELQGTGDEYGAAEGAGVISGYHWGGPASTIAVTYTFGYSTIPSDLKALTLRVAARSVNNPDGIRQEALGAYSVTYPEIAAGSGGGYLNDGEKRELRRRYGHIAGTFIARGANAT